MLLFGTGEEIWSKTQEIWAVRPIEMRVFAFSSLTCLETFTNFIFATGWKWICSSKIDFQPVAKKLHELTKKMSYYSNFLSFEDFCARIFRLVAFTAFIWIFETFYLVKRLLSLLNISQVFKSRFSCDYKTKCIIHCIG